MRVFTGVASAAALLTAGATVHGGMFQAGDYVYTNNNIDTIVGYSFGSGMATNLLTFNDPNNDQYRIADLTRVNGAFYVNSGFGDADDGNPGRLIRINNLLSGAGTFSDLSFGDPLQNPIGLEYHAPSGQFLVVNSTNQTQNQMAPNRDGIIGVDFGTGNTTQRFLEDVNSTDFPRYAGGAYITDDVNNGDRFYVTSVNGGGFRTGMDGNLGISSQIYAANVDTMTGDVTVEQVVDFDGSAGAFGPLTFVRGITSTTGVDGLTDLYVTDGFTNAIYRVDLDASGQFAGIDLIIDGLDNPQTIEYNQFRGSLIFHELGAQTISEVLLDGTGLTVLETGVVSARGFYIVPAPGAMALFGLGGLVAARRRR